jgi:hypothetical protein
MPAFDVNFSPRLILGRRKPGGTTQTPHHHALDLDAFAPEGLGLAIERHAVVILRDRLDRGQASVDALLDHAALKLGESSRDLEEELAGERGRIKMLLLEIQVHSYRLEVLDGG